MNGQYGLLSDYFDCFCYKKLKPVEVDPRVSNEHEFNGVSQLKAIFGREKKEKIPCRVHYLCDDENRLLDGVLYLTWYDARERHPKRSEYRLYYTDSACIDAANPDDVMILCRCRREAGDGDSFVMFISRQGDTVTAQLLWLFGIAERQLSFGFESKDTIAGGGLDFYTAGILERAGMVLLQPDDALLEKILEQFPDVFPSTRAFSTFARAQSDVDPLENPDLALSQWLSDEDHAFRLLEKYQLESKIRAGFESVDEFIRFSLSVQNRRKSRAGYALENHLAHLFTRLEIAYSYNVPTEHNSRPDFVFPGIDAYRDELFPTERLTMLGAKTTCKDRWRQVLAEAQRIPVKHLCTLEPGISVSQTDEMQASQLQLVVPKAIVNSFTQEQQRWLMPVSEFVRMVKQLQKSRE